MTNPIPIFRHIYRLLRYQFIIAKYHFMFGKYYGLLRYLKIRMEIFIIERRIKMKNEPDLYLLKVLSRFVRMKKYLGSKHNRESIVLIGQQIAEISNKTGIPQWQLRDRLQRDFDIDI